MSQAGKMSGKKHAFSLLFLVTLIIGTFWFLLRDIGVKGLFTAVRQAKPEYLLIGLVMVLVFFFCEGEAIRAVTGSLGYKSTRRRGFIYACVDFYFSAITPSATGGQPVCLYYMSKDKIPVSVSGLALLLQTVVFKMVLILLGTWVLVAKQSMFVEGSWLIKLLYVAGFLINIIVIGVCLMAMFSRKAIHAMAIWVIRLAAKIKIVKHPEEMTQKLLCSLEEYAQGADYIRSHIGLVVRVFLVTFIQRMAMFSVAYWVYRAMGFSRYTFMDMIALQTLIAMTIDSLPLPGGMGATEGVFSVLYKTVYATSLLVPALILTRGINYYFGLIVSSLCVIFNQSRIVRLEQLEKAKENE